MNLELEKRTKKTISARVDEEIMDVFTKQGLPVSQVVEAGIIYFLKLKEQQRISFIAENSVEVTDEKEIVISETQWTDFLQQQLGTTRAKHLVELAILSKKIGSDFETTRKTLAATGGIGVLGAIPILGAFAASSAAVAALLVNKKKKEE